MLRSCGDVIDGRIARSLELGDVRGSRVRDSGRMTYVESCVIATFTACLIWSLT